MALVAAQTVVAAGLNPTPITPTASDTISGSDILPGGGCVLRVVTTGTPTNVAVQDPGVTQGLGNPGTVTAVACPATGVRYILVAPGAVNPSTNVATVTFSSLTGVTYDCIKF